jgi:hypothetical protein
LTQELFPEIQAAAEALEKRIAMTENEVEEMKGGIKMRRLLLRSWRKALSAFAPKGAQPKQRPTTVPKGQRSASGVQPVS